jgi:hypothetical protein
MELSSTFAYNGTDTDDDDGDIQLEITEEEDDNLQAPVEIIQPYQFPVFTGYYCLKYIQFKQFRINSSEFTSILSTRIQSSNESHSKLQTDSKIN